MIRCNFSASCSVFLWLPPLGIWQMLSVWCISCVIFLLRLSCPQFLQFSKDRAQLTSLTEVRNSIWCVYHLCSHVFMRFTCSRPPKKKLVMTGSQVHNNNYNHKSPTSYTSSPPYKNNVGNFMWCLENSTSVSRWLFIVCQSEPLKSLFWLFNRYNNLEQRICFIKNMHFANRFAIHSFTIKNILKVIDRFHTLSTRVSQNTPKSRDRGAHLPNWAPKGSTINDLGSGKNVLISQKKKWGFILDLRSSVGLMGTFRSVMRLKVYSGKPYFQLWWSI